MIYSLRRLHGRTFLVLGIGLPALLVSGVASRQSLPKAAPTRSDMLDLTPVAEQTARIGSSPVRIRTFRDHDKLLLQISSPVAISAPDVLVYASRTIPTDMIGDDAIFLGEYAPDKLYPLPAAEYRFVALYSLAHRQVLTTFPLAGRP